MTMFAPSDICSLTVGEGHNGCGEPHVRPVDVEGLPVQPWALSCALCEAFLRVHDGRWSLTVEDIKPTYDEAKAEERYLARGAKDQAALMTAALAQLAGFAPSQIPQSVQRQIAGIRPHVPGQVVCAGCSTANQPGMKFCGSCGTALSTPVPAAAITSGPAA